MSSPRVLPASLRGMIPATAERRRDGRGLEVTAPSWYPASRARTEDAAILVSSISALSPAVASAPPASRQPRDR